MNPENNKNILFFMLFVVALEAILFFAGNNKSNNFFREEEVRAEKIQKVFQGIPLEAKAVSIYDGTTNKKIYGKNDSISLPIASLAKVMTVLIALNNLDTYDVVSVSQNSLKEQGDYGLFANEKFKIKDLAEFVLVGSANDGASALLEGIPDALEKMNTKARKIGMEHTLFLSFTGLDFDDGGTNVPLEPSAYASAEDVNIMVSYALKAHPGVFGASVLPEINIRSDSGFDHNIKNTNTILDKIPGILFSKTGLTPLAGGNLSIIFKNKNGHEIAITVLGSTETDRFSDMEKIVGVMYNLEDER